MTLEDAPKRSLSKLPTEIILTIAEEVTISELNCLIQSCRLFHNLLDARLYRLATNYTFKQSYKLRTPLSWAATYGRANTAQKLLAAGADVSAVIEGFPALHYAVTNGHTDVARLLLDAGANAAWSARNGDIPLTMAAARGNDAMVRLLLDYFSPNTPAEKSQYKRALCRAVFSGRLEVVRIMLGNPGVLVDPPAVPNDSSGTGWLDLARDEDMISEAARSGNCDMIRLLFEFGAKVQPLHRRSEHPLLVAAQKGHKEAVQLFIAASADPKYDNRRDKTESLKSASFERTDVTRSAENRLLAVRARLSQKYGPDLNQPGKDGRTPLQVALEEFSEEAVIHELLRHGADPGRQGRGGSTAVHTLVRLKRHDLLETLVSASDSLSTADDNGNTPLLLAVTVFNVEATGLFVKCGADIMARDKHGRTPLHIAASHSSGVILSMLLEAGADVSATDRDGRRPLHFATLSGNHSVFKALLSTHDKTGTEYLSRSQTGRTALEMAVEGGYRSLVELLIERGVNFKDGWEGYSALHAAVANGHQDIAALLLTQGADPLRLDYYGRTPYDWASDNRTMLDTMVQSCDVPYARTQRDTQLAVLRDGVVRFASDIKNGKTDDFYKLAKCLVYLNDGEGAVAVFREAASSTASSDDLRYPMGCSQCRPRLKRDSRSDYMVLVCRRCHELDMCDWGSSSPFVGVSSDAGFGVGPEGTAGTYSANAASWEQQLKRLITKYS